MDRQYSTGVLRCFEMMCESSAIFVAVPDFRTRGGCLVGCSGWTTDPSVRTSGRLVSFSGWWPLFSLASGLMVSAESSISGLPSH